MPGSQLVDVETEMKQRDPALIRQRVEASLRYCELLSQAISRLATPMEAEDRCLGLERMLNDLVASALERTTVEEKDACFFQPIHNHSLSLLGDVDLIQEKLTDLRLERSQLLYEQESRTKFGVSLDKASLDFLESFQQQKGLLLDELKLTELNLEGLRQAVHDDFALDVLQEEGIQGDRGLNEDGRTLHQLMPVDREIASSWRRQHRENDILDERWRMLELSNVDHDFSSGGVISNKQKGRERSMLPTLINGIPFDALPDTNASENFITTEQVAQIGASIDRSADKQRTYQNACGGAFKTVGEAVFDISFPSNPSQVWRQCRFFVVEKLAAAVIMGDPFLTLTETLTKFRYRLKKVSNPFKKLWRVCLLDTPRRQMSCYIDGAPVMVSADTGSDVDLISLDYAKSHGWHIHKMPKENGFVVLADGTEKQLSGYVNIPLRIGSSAYSATLYVLEGLVCDVLLGDSTLDEIDAFNRHEDCFVVIDPEDEFGICHNINWCEVTDRHLEQILEGKFPEKTAAQLQEHRFNRVKFKVVPSARNVQAWEEAFDRALHHLENREVTARTKAQQDIAKFSGSGLERATRLERERRERHRQRAKTIRRQRDKFLGVAPSTM